jgi:queuosine precursor transporter
VTGWSGPAAHPMTRMARTTVIASALVASVALANYATSRFGFVPVGFGLAATAGTFAAGACLALRDALQDAGGRWAVAAAILAGALVSVATSSPALALASGAAFLASELADAAVYTPLRHHSEVGDSRWSAAVAGSNLVGTIVDSALFLGLAFGPAAILPALAGQLVGKAYPTLAYLTLGWGRRAVHGEPVHAEGA